MDQSFCIDQFQLYLFDFDGLLVNTEEIQYRAYQKMCHQRHFPFPFTFEEYCQTAHYESDAFRERLYQRLPELKKMEPRWDILYAEKKEAVLHLLQEGAVSLMPGVQKFLTLLESANIKRAVVTNSPEESVNILKKQHPILHSIPHWITRQWYSQPKPHPECYLKAIQMLAVPGESAIGFEDSPRGLKALMGTTAQPVLISPIAYPEIQEFCNSGVWHYRSFKELDT